MSTDLPDKAARLIGHLEDMVTYLNQRRDLRLHLSVSQFYYMQKSAELKLLCERLTEAREQLQRLDELLEGQYKEIYVQWYRDLKQVRLSPIHE